MRFNASVVAAPWMCLLVLSLSNFASSFSPTSIQCSTLRYGQKLYHHHDVSERRTFLEKSASMIGLVTAVAPPANAVEVESSSATPIPSNPIATGNFDCLLDLPPITPGCVRLYLCRHGQTENNRLHLVQGARVDPSINGNGHEQAQRLGMAISTLIKSSSSRGAVPKLAVHSKLRRSRETAEVLTSTASSQSSASKESALKILGEVSSIGEVDFGSLEGVDVKYFRRAMRETFASWSFGDIDRRSGGGGESGREVLERAAQSLEELSKLASSSTSSSSILAVSHSGYLKILMALVSDTPLVAVKSIQNGSVNVVDVNVEGKRRLVTSSSGLFGGEIVDRLRGSNGLKLDMPEVHLIRRNEVRHLEGMDV